MFKNKGKFAAALSEVREFEGKKGLVMKFDPKYYPPFVCKAPNSDDWKTMTACWDDYASVKEIFPDLGAIKCCVINYLLGKEDISDEVVDAILAMGNDSFWIRVSGGGRTRGFHPRTELSMCADVDDFRLEKHGDMYLAVDKSK